MSKSSWMLIILVLLMVTTAPVWALNGATLLGQSASGQTALFNLGVHDGVKEGDYAVVVKEIRDLETRDLRLVPVAKARNIKINTGNSVWILYKIYAADLLVKGQSYLVLSESAMLSGRRDPRFNRITVVTNKDKTAFQVQKALGEDKDRLAKLEKQYPEISELHKRDTRSDADGELIDVEGWKKFKGERHRTALYKSPYQDDFRRQLRLTTFEKLVTGYLKKVNDPKFSYDQFYDEQMKAEFSNEFRKRSNFDTEYETFLSNQAQKTAGNAKLYRSILEKGESWSEDFSDEELRTVLGQVSVLQEKDRRDYVVSDPNRYTVYLEYGLGINDPQTDKDTRYRRDTRYSVDLDFEAVPFLKHDALERFTLNASVRSNKTAFDASGNNANVDEYSFTGGMNWYPLYAPYVIEAPVIFLGVYLRSGWASVEAPTVAEKANYTVLSLPGLRAGMKYNFKNNLALRVSASMEQLQLDRYEQSKLGSVLPDQTNVAEAKLNFALAYSF